MRKVITRNYILLPLLLLIVSILLGCDLLPFGNNSPGGEYEYTRTPQNLLFVTESDYSASSENPMVDMEFAPPSELGASMYTLQQSTDEGTTWSNFQYYGEDLTTTVEIQDNFSIDLGENSLIRLLITGGDYDGHTSNEVEVILSNIDTYFSGWYISDSGGYYDSILSESVGHTITASFTVKKNTPENTVVEDALTYQWYRINSDDFEDITPIDGATLDEYTTTTADRGYVIMIRATGDGVDAGGYCQLLGTYIT